MLRIERGVFISVILILCLYFSGLGIVQAAEDTECTITIYRVQLIDEIETAFLLEGEADWYYNVTVTDTSGTSSVLFDDDSEQNDIYFNNDHDFSVASLQITIRIFLFEDDTFGYETADISSSSSRRYFVGYYNLETNSLTGTGDTAQQEGDYYKISGDFDGTTGTDDNDANLWFRITDNYNSPVANAGTDRTTVSGDKINFDASQSSASLGSDIVSYQWDFENDGVFDAEGVQTSFTYSEKGSYTVILKITDNYGKTSTDTCSIQVTNPLAPIASAGSDRTIPSGQKINFDGALSSTFGSEIVKYQWDFENDGVFDAEGVQTSFTYSEKGSYTVLLKITDNYGQTSSDTCVITVTNSLPSSSFTRLPLEPTIFDAISFSETCSDSDGTIISWYWDFGDGTTSNERNPSHHYSQKGTYSVSLKATDNDNDWDTTTIQITVVNLEPTAVFTASTSTLIIGDTVDFSENSTDPENAIVERVWDFGDGSVSTTKNPSHMFETTGTYQVTLTVTDDEGLTDSTSIAVHVSEPSIMQEYQFPIIIVAAVAIVAVVLFFVLRKQKT